MLENLRRTARDSCSYFQLIAKTLKDLTQVGFLPAVKPQSRLGTWGKMTSKSHNEGMFAAELVSEEWRKVPHSTESPVKTNLL
jgi:hypothetical protein